MISSPQAKLLWHGARVSDFLTTGRTDPVLIEISPIGYCNAKCPWCFFKDKHESERIDPAILLRAIEEMPDSGIRAINWTGGGEPTLHPEFRSFVEAADDLGIEQGLFTNGYQEIPNQESFKWIRISLTDKGFDAIKFPKVPFGIVHNQVKEDEEEHLRDLCREAFFRGARYFQIRPALLGDWRIQPRIFPPEYLKEYEKFPGFSVLVSGYKYEDAIRPKEYESCFGYHFVPSLDWRGRVGVCLYLLNDPEYQLGDLHKQTFLDIVRNFPKEKSVIPGCQNCCKNHEINKMLSAASSSSSVNFL